METWLAQYFVHSAYVPWGAALVAAPVLIHLINRLRFRVVRFAAMEFLLQSQKRNRRRILLEQLLLLLLRVLIVAVLVALVARLVLDPLQLSLLRGARVHHVVVLDDSGSMRDRWGDQTAFERALNVVRQLVQEGARRPGTQRFSLILLSNPQQPLFSERDVDDLFWQELQTRLENLRCTHRRLSLEAALEAAGRLLSTDRTSVKHLHVLSDFRRVDWQDQRALVDTLQGLHDSGVHLNLVPVVPSGHSNLSVVGLTGDVQVAAAGVPLRLKVRVKNFGTQVARNVRLTVSQDHQKLPLTVQFESVEPGAEVEREFDLVFEQPGPHEVDVALAGDALIEDNTCFLAVDVSPVNRVLIVQGAPGQHDAEYLADALAADPRVTGYAPRIELVDYLRQADLSQYQSVYLLNVAELPTGALQALQRYVAEGGGLAVFLGDQVNADFYNDVLWHGGQGLFPLPLARAPKSLPPRLAGTTEPDLKLTDHPIFRVFAGQENPYIEVTRVYRYFPPADGWQRDDQRRADGTRTLASLRNGDPFLLERRYGAGRVVVCTSTCGPTWNNLALYASFVVVQLELQKYIARPDRALPQRVVGEPIRLELDPSEFRDVVELTTPELAGQRVVRINAAPLTTGRGAPSRAAARAGSSTSPKAPNRPARPNATLPADSPPGRSTDARSQQPVRLLAEFTDTDTPGIYVARLTRHDGQTEQRWFAYNFPAAESELRVLSERDLRALLGNLPARIQEPGDLQWLTGRAAGQEVRNLLLVLLLVLLVSEQALAWHASYHLRDGGVRTGRSGPLGPSRPEETGRSNQTADQSALAHQA